MSKDLKYRSKKVKDVATQELLWELLERQGTDESPVKMTFYVPHRISLIEIGKDHTADIIIENDAMAKLEEMVESHDSPKSKG